MNTATASATSSQGMPLTAGPSFTETATEQDAAVSVAKEATVADMNANGVTDLGDVITWTFTVTNVGNVTLHALMLDDPMVTATCAATTVAPGASTTCAADTTHVITQAEVDAGLVTNTVTATALDADNVVVRSGSTAVTTPVNQIRGWCSRNRQPPRCQR